MSLVENVLIIVEYIYILVSFPWISLKIANRIQFLSKLILRVYR